jgi:hypothetical protein
MIRLPVALLAGVAAFVLLLALPQPALAGTTSLTADLEPTDAAPDASGTASFEMDQHHSVFSVAVSYVPADTVDVYVNGEFVGSIDLDHTGSGHLVLSSYHVDVPELSEGDYIEIVDDTDGTLLLDGTLE